MAELLSTLTSWNTFFYAILTYGFAPGFVLRIIVRIYPKHDPRRDELVAEMYVVPRILRPLWVAEQFEVALFEGIGARLRVARTKRRIRAFVRSVRTTGPRALIGTLILASVATFIPLGFILLVQNSVDILKSRDLLGKAAGLAVLWGGIMGVPLLGALAILCAVEFVFKDRKRHVVGSSSPPD